MTTNQYNALCAHLGLIGGKVSAKFKCPCHDDKTASGVASRGGDGKVLLNCHGCGSSFADILSAWGFDMQDAFPPDQDKKPSKPKPTAKREAEYLYSPTSKKVKMRQADGGKYCFWQHLDGEKWVKSKGAEPNVLFSNGIESDAVYIVEGEKDVQTMAALGLSACSLPDGAKSKWEPQYADTLKGKTVCIIQDNDDPGKQFSQRIASVLQGIASTTKVIDLTEADPDLPPKADITDFHEKYGKGETLATIQALSVTTPEWVPGTEPATIGQPRRNPGGALYGERVSIDITKCAMEYLGLTVRNDLLLKQAEIKGLPECYSVGNAINILPVYLMDYLKSSGVKGVNQQVMDGYLACIADENRFNPIMELLSTTAWDGSDRLQEIYQILGVTAAQHQTYIRKWLIQCIALGLNDEECPIGAEGVLVLQGEQGLAKTSFFRAISPYPRWFCEGAVIDVSEKDSILNATGSWITELGELDSTLKREQSALKAFITSPEDRVRAPYARNATRTPRRTSFAGSVNPADYLRDETGSRRFWTVPVTKIDKKTLFALPPSWSKQLWSQVYVLYLENHNGFRLTDEEMKRLQDDNRTFSIPLPYETEIRELLDYALPIEQWQWWRAKEIRAFLPNNADAVKVGKALKKVVGEQVVSTPLGTPLTPLKTTRLKDGNTEYFMPLKHFTQSWAASSGA